MRRWKRGLPPGQYYEGMVDDYEVRFAVLGGKWHRRRSEREKRAYLGMKAEIERRKLILTAHPFTRPDGGGAT